MQGGLRRGGLTSFFGSALSAIRMYFEVPGIIIGKSRPLMRQCCQGVHKNKSFNALSVLGTKIKRPVAIKKNCHPALDDIQQQLAAACDGQPDELPGHHC